MRLKLKIKTKTKKHYIKQASDLCDPGKNNLRRDLGMEGGMQGLKRWSVRESRKGKINNNIHISGYKN